MTEHDMVNHPPHYNAGAVECIDAIEAAMTFEEFVGYLRGQIIKYVWRAGRKGDAREDIEKALWYGNKLATRLSDCRIAQPCFGSEWQALSGMADRAVAREAAEAAPREAAEGSTAIDYDRLSTLEDTAGNVLLEHTDAVDWTTAPAWASYLAVDEEDDSDRGVCLAYWFQERPEWRENDGSWSSGGQGGRIMAAEEFSFGMPRLFVRTRAPE